MKEISKELAKYIRSHSPTIHIHNTVRKCYVEESKPVERLIIQFEKEKSKKKGCV